jgi:hypothetical protein
MEYVLLAVIAFDTLAIFVLVGMIREMKKERFKPPF